MLTAAFPDAERIWIAVLRRQDELLPSLYSEHVKRGLIAFPQTYDVVSGPEFLDHVRRLETIAGASEGDKLLIARFDDIRHDLIASFLEMIEVTGLETPTAKEDQHRNRALPDNTLKAMRYVNALPGPLRRIVHPRFMKLLRHLFAGAALPPAALDAVQRHYETGNAALENAFFTNLPSRLSTRPPAGELAPLSEQLFKQVVPWHPSQPASNISAAPGKAS